MFWKLLTIFEKHFLLDVWQGSEYVSETDHQINFGLYHLSFDFLGKSGKVKLDPYGDRIPQLTISNYHQGEEQFIANFNPDKQHILQDNNFQSPIYFADGTTTVPIDEPICGFQGSKCKEKGK